MSDAVGDLVRYVDPKLAEQVEATYAEREVFDEINARVAARDSIESIIEYVFEATRPITPCDRIGLAFLDRDGRIVSHCTVTDYEPVLLKRGYAEDLSAGSLKAVLDRGWPRIINDLEAYAAAHPKSHSSAVLVREGVRSSLTCPLVVEDRVVGVMFRSARKPGVYNEKQVSLHLAIAGRLSQAVEKARQIEELKEANRAYSEMLGFISHELKSPLGSMLTSANLILDGYAGDPTELQVEILERIVASGEYLMGMVHDYLDLARLESDALAINARPGVKLGEDVIERALNILKPQMEVRKVRFEREVADDLPAIEADTSLLQVALVNLLSNAVKYGNEGGLVRLRVAYGDGALRIMVWNEGPGFPAEERSRLFRKFSRLDTPELRDRKGTGVGLYTVWRIARMHGGRTWATSEYGQWAEFGIEIPQPLPKTAATHS